MISVGLKSKWYVYSEIPEPKVAWPHCGYTTHYIGEQGGVPLPLFVHIDDGKPLPITQSLQDCASVRLQLADGSRAILEGNRRHLEFFRTEKLHPEGAQSLRVRLRRYLMKLPLHVCVAPTRRWQKHLFISSNRGAQANKTTEIPNNRLCIDSC